MEMAVRRREQEIWHALDDLWAFHGDAKNLTGDAIRERLVAMGKSRGSPNEIYKYRKTWVHSRGVRLHEQHLAEERTEDPISRAVHIVHEKLKEESLQQIDEIKKNYEQKLAVQEEELAKVKDALGKLVAEYGELERDRAQVLAHKDAITQELKSETDIRQAGERELGVIKLTLHHERSMGEKLLSELKAVHAQQVDTMIEEGRLREQSALHERQQLIAEKRLMGEQFSEQLNQLKLDIYNKDILIKNITQKSIDLENNLELEISKTNLLQQEKALLEKSVSQMHQELQHKQASLNLRFVEQKVLTLELRKAQLTIARLRAMQAHSKKPYETVPRR